MKEVNVYNNITTSQLELLRDFCLLYLKIISKCDNSFLSFYDKRLIEIIEEYDFYITEDYKKDYLEREFYDF